MRRLSFIAAIVLGSVIAASGQLPPPSSVVSPSATAPPGAPDMVTLQYPNSDVVDVLRLYETLTGLKLIMDNFVQGKVSIFIPKPVPREEAIKIIEINLLLNKYSLVPAGDGLVKVIGTGQNPRTAGVPIISDESMIPDGDHVISFLFKLRYADPTELQQVLGQYLSPPQAYTSFLALPKSSSILVTENSSVIRSLVKIIDQVDIPPAEVVSEFIKLERADASKVVDMLKDVFEKGNQPGGPGPGGVRNVRGIPAPPVPGAQGANSFEVNDNGLTALTEDSIVVGKIKIAADVRTNRIHVITRPVNMPFIKKLISEFDANVDFATPVTRPLRYISAATVLPVIVQTLTEAGSEGGAGGNPPGLGQNPNQPPNQNRNNPNNFNNSANNNNLNGSGSGGGGQSFSEELSTQAVDTTPQAVTIGNSKIIADPRANTIIILGNREVVVKVMKLLDEMDVSAPQVALSTVIGELRLSNNEEFGVDFFQNFTKFDPSNPGGRGGAAGFARNTGAPLFSASDLRNFTQLAAAASTGGASVFITGALGLSTIVHALDSTGRFKTISRPTIFTSNNKKAIIASGTEIPVPVSTLSQPLLTGQNVSQQSNIQFKKIALQLEVVPLINSQKEVTLDILQKLDSVDGFTQVDNNQIPNIATRYIKTTVSAPNCATIALGGLITDSVSRNTSGIPILSRIPLVGGIFRNTAKPKERRELIILMRPEVSLTKLEAERLRHKAEDRTHFGPELNQDDCPDCPKPADASKDLTPPDLPDLPAPK